MSKGCAACVDQKRRPEKLFKVSSRKDLRQLNFVSDKERHLLVGVTVPIMSVIFNERLAYFFWCVLMS